jgi:phosphatidylglycerophosphate synthase
VLAPLRRLGVLPSHITVAAFVVSLAAAGVIATGRLIPGLALMGLGQVLDGLDGAMARLYHLGSATGARLDTQLDRASEAVLFAACGVAGLAPWKLVLLALAAIVLMTTIVERSHVDLGVKRVALYLGLWFPYRTIFLVIFAVNLTAYVIGLLVCDIQFQKRMDDLGGDLDTVASRAAATVRGTR